MNASDCEQQLDLWFMAASLAAATGESVEISGPLLAAFAKLAAPPGTGTIGEFELEENVVIARARYNIEHARRAASMHWVAWWGEDGYRTQNVFDCDTRTEAVETITSELQARQRREGTDLSAVIEAFAGSQIASARWEDPETGSTTAYWVQACTCPDPDWSRCVTYKRARRGEYNLPE